MLLRRMFCVDEDLRPRAPCRRRSGIPPISVVIAEAAKDAQVVLCRMDRGLSRAGRPNVLLPALRVVSERLSMPYAAVVPVMASGGELPEGDNSGRIPHEANMLPARAFAPMSCPAAVRYR